VGRDIRTGECSLLFIMCYGCFIDPPRNLQIAPRQSTYKPGDRIRCSVEGNPEPSYQWTNLINRTVIRGSVLVITKDNGGQKPHVPVYSD